jgi:hypothetical protein
MADLLNDLAMTLDLLSPLFPAYFLMLVCSASIFRSIVGVAGGCSRVLI